MANNTNNETTFSNPIEKLLAISSGASLDILRECPRTEIIKHAGIGGTILLTSLLALISGSYALFSVFKSYPAAILFGLVWALMIFNLDRLIVSSMRKRGVWLQQIKMATPRILLAIIIAIVISKPLEVRLLETRINKVLSDDLANKKTSLEQEKQGIIDFYTGKIANQQEKTTNYLGEKPVLLESLETDKKALLVKKGIEEKKAAKRNASLFRAIELAQQKLTFNKTILNPNTSTLKSIDELPSDIEALRKQITRNRATVVEIERQITIINNKIDTQFDNFNTQFATLQAQVNLQITLLERQKEEALVEFGKSAEDIIDTIGANSLIDQMIALSKAGDKDEIVFWISCFITLLFITVETAPIFVKLISPRGPYDDLLDASEYKIQIKAKDRMNLTTQAHNKKIEISAKMDKQEVIQEVSNNKAILETISNAHQILIKDQVEDWLERERNKLRKNKNKLSDNIQLQEDQNKQMNGHYLGDKQPFPKAND